MSNFPTSLDSTSNMPNNRATDDVIPASDNNDKADAIIALETKVGTGASTPTANKVLRATGTGTSAWEQVEVGDLEATGTASSSTFLRGDGSWASPAGGGGGDLLAANNLSDVADAPTSLSNLGGASATALSDHITDTDDAHDASAISVDNTAFDVLTGTDNQALWEENDTALLNARNTGVRFGGRPTIDGGAGVGTTVSITAGAGTILDITDAENPVYTDVSWDAISNEAVTSTSPNITYWYFDDNSGSIKQTTTKPTFPERKGAVYLFRTVWNNGAISSIGAEIVQLQQTAIAIAGLSEVIGAVNLFGSEPTNSGTNLNLKITAGKTYKYGSNYFNSYIDPHAVAFDTFDTAVADTFRYAIESGVIATDETEIDVANYNLAGTVTAIPGSNTRVGIHYIFRFNDSGNVRVAYGNEWYTDATSAVEAIPNLNPRETVPASFSNAVLLGAIIAQKNETDLSNATFVIANKFGDLSSGSISSTVGGSYLEVANNLSDLQDAPTARTNLGLGTASEANTIDEDDMVSDSATAVPTQQSVKAYVDTEVAGAGGGGGGSSAQYIPIETITTSTDLTSGLWEVNTAGAGATYQAPTASGTNYAHMIFSSTSFAADTIVAIQNFSRVNLESSLAQWDKSQQVTAMLKVNGPTNSPCEAIVGVFDNDFDAAADLPFTKTQEHFGIYRITTGGTTTWFASNASGSTQTSTDISSAFANNTYATIRIDYTGGTDVKFYVNGTLEATHTTNLPTGQGSGFQGSVIAMGNTGGQVGSDPELHLVAFQRSFLA